MELTENAMKILRTRYLRRNEKGEVVETPDEMFRRVARHVAKAESIYDQDGMVPMFPFAHPAAPLVENRHRDTVLRRPLP